MRRTPAPPCVTGTGRSLISVVRQSWRYASERGREEDGGEGTICTSKLDRGAFNTANKYLRSESSSGDRLHFGQIDKFSGLQRLLHSRALIACQDSEMARLHQAGVPQTDLGRGYAKI